MVTFGPYDFAANVGGLTIEEKRTLIADRSVAAIEFSGKLTASVVLRQRKGLLYYLAHDKEIQKVISKSTKLSIQMHSFIESLSVADITIWNHVAMEKALDNAHIFDDQLLAPHHIPSTPQMWLYSNGETPPLVGSSFVEAFGLTLEHANYGIVFSAARVWDSEKRCRVDSLRITFILFPVDGQHPVFLTMEDIPLGDTLGGLFSQYVAQVEFMRLPFVHADETHLPRSEARQLKRKEKHTVVLPSTVRTIVLRRPAVKGETAVEKLARDHEFQWCVRGHWRNQWHPSILRHKPKWIQGYMKGNPDKPVMPEKTTVYLMKR